MIGKQRYGLPADEDWGTEPRIEASKVRLRDVLQPGKNVIDYHYDFGDSWEHRITITNIRPGESGVSYPRYIAGEWNAPPEDCGGIPGFYALLEAVADPAHESYAEAKGWLDDYDPKSIDELPIRYALSRIANRVMLPRPASPTKSIPPHPAEQPQSIAAVLTGWSPVTTRTLSISPRPDFGTLPEMADVSVSAPRLENFPRRQGSRKTCVYGDNDVTASGAPARHGSANQGRCRP
jgi:Plasmid pRiA4b ORF-3-like protein